LGFLVSKRGIEVDPDKIKAILEMPEPRTEKEVRSFLGKLQYISRFISKLSSVCGPIFRLLRKDQPSEWNERCHQAFQKIRETLLNPPILQPPNPEKPFLLYLSVEDTATGAMLAQMGNDGAEHAKNDLSKKFNDYEVKYTPVERTCASLVWVTRKLRHYLLTSKTIVISRLNPLQYLLEKPALVGKLARWLLLLSELHLEYVTKKSVKGRIIAEYLAGHPVDVEPEAEYEFPSEHLTMIEALEAWEMYFDGAANKSGRGAGVVLITPDGLHLPMALKIDFPATNNVAEYEALIFGLEALCELGVSKVIVYPP
jgi:hypothetical protein